MTRQFTLIKITLIILLVASTHSSVFGQNEVTERYVRTDYPRGTLILNSDKSFKYQFRFDSQWDLACGQFEIKKDTIYFTYTSDMLDVVCNNERINMADTSDYFLRTGVDKRYRPIIALIVKRKILIIKTGDINEPKTIDSGDYYYRREKKSERK